MTHDQKLAVLLVFIFVLYLLWTGRHNSRRNIEHREKIDRILREYSDEN